MLALLKVTFRGGVSQADGKAAAQLIQERMANPRPDVKVICSVMDLGAGEMYTIADYTNPNPTAANVERFLEFRILPAVESVTFTPVLETKDALAAYMKVAG
jgi:hypothetical protein